MGYAQGTSVPVDRSRAQIEHVLKIHGADNFAYATDADRAVMIAFRLEGRLVRFHLPMVDPERFRMSKGGVRRSDLATENAHAQEVRRRWRALWLVIKAKLEAVESGITTFEEEFYAHILLPGGRTVYEETREGIAQAYQSGQVPQLLSWAAPSVPDQQAPRTIDVKPLRAKGRK